MVYFLLYRKFLEDGRAKKVWKYQPFFSKWVSRHSTFLCGSVSMNIYYVMIMYAVALIVFAIIHKIGKNKKPVRRGLLSLITGFLCLVAVNLASVFTGVYLPYSMFTIAVSTIGGIPGVTALLTLNLFF